MSRSPAALSAEAGGQVGAHAAALVAVGGLVAAAAAVEQVVAAGRPGGSRPRARRSRGRSPTSLFTKSPNSAFTRVRLPVSTSEPGPPSMKTVKPRRLTAEASTLSSPSSAYTSTEFAKSPTGSRQTTSPPAPAWQPSPGVSGAPASRNTTVRIFPADGRVVTVTRLASPGAALRANETAVPSSSVSSETETVAAEAAWASKHCQRQGQPRCRRIA